MRIMACVATSSTQTYRLIPAATHFGDLRCEQFFKVCWWRFASNARSLPRRRTLLHSTYAFKSSIANETTLHRGGLHNLDNLTI